MAYDEALANRIRRALGKRSDFEEKRMFGGLAFMVRGHMCCGVIGRDMMVRVGPERHAEALAQPHAREMDFTGRPSKNMVYVGAGGVATEPSLQTWTGRALAFVSSLPAKATKKTTRTRTRTAKTKTK